MPRKAAPAPIVTGSGGVAGSLSPTCQKMLEPAQVFGATIGATTMAAGATVSAPATLKIHGPLPVSVSVPFSTASPVKQ